MANKKQNKKKNDKFVNGVLGFFNDVESFFNDGNVPAKKNSPDKKGGSKNVITGGPQAIRAAHGKNVPAPVPPQQSLPPPPNQPDLRRVQSDPTPLPASDAVPPPTTDELVDILLRQGILHNPYVKLCILGDDSGIISKVLLGDNFKYPEKQVNGLDYVPCLVTRQSQNDNSIWKVADPVLTEYEFALAFGAISILTTGASSPIRDFGYKLSQTHNLLLDNVELVRVQQYMKYLLSTPAVSHIYFSIFDFTSVKSGFAVISNLYLPDSGIVICSFDIAEFCSPDEKVSERCIGHLKWQLNNVTAQCCKKSGRDVIGPGIAIVGIADDIGYFNMDFIHSMLLNIISETPYYQLIITPSLADGFRCFFPICRSHVTVVSRQGSTTLRNSLENYIVNKKKYRVLGTETPFYFFKSLDLIQSENASVMLESAMLKKCADYLPPEEVVKITKYFSSIGWMIRFDLQNPNKFVITKPIEFIYNQAIKLFLPEGDLKARITIAEHPVCARTYPEDWKLFDYKSIIDRKLLKVLWSDLLLGQWLTELFIITGILYPFARNHIVDEVYTTKYLVPMNLKCSIGSELAENQKRTCLFVLLSKEITTNYVDRSTIRKLSMLNERIYFGLLTSFPFENLRDISLNAFDIEYQDRKFRISLVDGQTQIKLEIEGEHGLPIQEMVYSRLSEVIKQYELPIFCYCCLCCGLTENLILLTKIQQAADKENRSPLKIDDGIEEMAPSKLDEEFKDWLKDPIVNEPDVFISYRWVIGKDSELVEKLYSEFRPRHLALENKRRVYVFRDNKFLKEGETILEFLTYLLRSRVVVPMVSVNALERMLRYDDNFGDNLLLEWAMTITIQSIWSDKKVYPIIFGDVDIKTENVCDFDWSMVGRLPEVIPWKIWNQVKEKLSTEGVTCTEIQPFDIRSIVKKILDCLGLAVKRVKENNNMSSIVQTSSQAIVRILNDYPRHTTTNEAKDDML